MLIANSNDQEERFNQIINAFDPKIKKVLANTPLQEREDLEQEIKIKIYEKMDVLDSFNAPGFFEFLTN
ncbi:hypothetical protein [Pontibacillus halophilus]|uniref:hypothetical protein n=1 Tax=Pontibacillus halophilus TaxID=516704 RepID=UPI000412B8F9|nr:hypothetical protein [Pontibacillus halophilus]